MLQAVVDVLKNAAFDPSIRTYRGSHSRQLEEDLCHLTGQSECLLFSSATAGLETLLRALKIGPQDEVVLSGYDYPGNFWAVERVGARPVLIDIETVGWNVNLQALEESLSQPGHAIKAVLVSHLHGQLQDSLKIHQLCSQAGVPLIEDCCQSLAAFDATNAPVGSTSDAMLLSFGGGKTITSGRGGALLTSDPRLAQRARVASGAGSGPYSLSELQSVMVTAQLPWVEAINAASRKEFALAHTKLVKAKTAIELILPCQNCIDRTSFYQCGWQVTLPNESGDPELDPSAQLAELTTQLINGLRSLGVPAGKGFDGFHRRSEKRCRIPWPLEETSRRVHQTLVIHHEYLLERFNAGIDLGLALREVLEAHS